MKIYTAHLSNKQQVKMDQEDFDKVFREMGRATFIKVKEAIINPSFLVTITVQEVDIQAEPTGYFDEEARIFKQTGVKEISPVSERFVIRSSEVKELR